MPIDTRTEAGAVIIVITGRLVLGRDVELLENMVTDALRGGQRRIVLDLSRLEYVDSSGVGTVVSCLSNAKKAGGELRLAGTSPRVEKIFKLTGVNSIVSMFPSVAAATASGN